MKSRFIEAARSFSQPKKIDHPHISNLSYPFKPSHSFPQKYNTKIKIRGIVNKFKKNSTYSTSWSPEKSVPDIFTICQAMNRYFARNLNSSLHIYIYGTHLISLWTMLAPCRCLSLPRTPSRTTPRSSIFLPYCRCRDRLYPATNSWQTYTTRPTLLPW